MNPGSEPRFLTRETVEAIHEEQIDAYGGLRGVRDENALKSAIAAAQNVYHQGGPDVYEVAASYAFHLAESQASLLLTAALETVAFPACLSNAAEKCPLSSL